jgi:hypothetical protein
MKYWLLSLVVALSSIFVFASESEAAKRNRVVVVRDRNVVVAVNNFAYATPSFVYTPVVVAYYPVAAPYSAFCPTVGAPVAVASDCEPVVAVAPVAFAAPVYYPAAYPVQFNRHINVAVAVRNDFVVVRNNNFGFRNNVVVVRNNNFGFRNNVVVVRNNNFGFRNNVVVVRNNNFGFRNNNVVVVNARRNNNVVVVRQGLFGRTVIRTR